MSVSKGLFPNVLKLARVIPIFKKGNKNDTSNYRPVSTISVFSKIFEYLMCNRLKKIPRQIFKTKFITIWI